MMLFTGVMFIAGLALLILGAEWLVRGSSRIAAWAGISPLVIGLTVVAFGTSAPELAINVQSALAGQPDIAIGNVVGSNIANVLLILGLSAAIAPLMVQQQVVRQDVPIMIGVSVVTFLFALNGLISTFEGFILFSALLVYTWFLIRQSRSESREVEQEYEQEYAPREQKSIRGWVWNIGLVLVGLGLLILGARWMVSSAVEVAHWLGVGELVIGLTVVAVGTSLPELATSVMAAIKGERDIAVGNVVGSNIFNLLSVLGLSAIIVPEGIPVSQAAIRFDIPIMIAVALASFPIFLTGGQIYRWEGLLFLGYYVVYTVYLVLNATHHSALPVFNNVMAWFVLPLTALTLVISLWYEFHVRRRA
ncbi:MAG: sodium:calcium antiporter [Anaerolineae bacterium]|nr:MAG: sodium:calcium antiporter [Anaerolineae bacterium]